MMTQSELEQERYESRLKAWRDERMRFDEATLVGEEKGHAKGHARGLAEGLAEGIKKGVAEGVKKGAIIGRIHVCQRLLKLVLTPTDELLSKSIEELEAAAIAFEQKVGLMS